jgi:hypothetical protein
LHTALSRYAHDGTELFDLVSDPDVRSAIIAQYGDTVTVDAAVEVVMALIERGMLR